MVAQQPSTCAQVTRDPVCRVALRTAILSVSLSHDRLRGIQEDTIASWRGGAVGLSRRMFATLS